MSFRDDREAAHRRADALQAELDQLKQQNATHQRPPPKGSGLRWVMGVLTATMLLGAGGWFYASLSRVRAERAEAEALVARHRAEERENQRLRAVLDARREAEQRTNAEQAAARAHAQEMARRGVLVEPGSPVVVARWPATVIEATGIDLAAGTPCTVNGAFVRVGASAQARMLVVDCGARRVYQLASDRMMTTATVGLREGPVFGTQSHQYLLSFGDEAECAGATCATISTTRHEAVLRREGAEAMRVTLSVRDVSEPHEGSALHLPTSRVVRQPAFADVIDRPARVMATRGQAPVARGARCSFAVRPVWEYPESCRIALRCGTTWLYGAREGGYLTCEVRDGHPIAALDENTTDHGGDPRVTWRGSRVTVSDFTESGEWAVDLSL